MKKLFLILALLPWASSAEAQYIERANCASYATPITNVTTCKQTTTVGGRTAGRLYNHNGSAWVDIDSGGGSVTSVGAVGTANQITVTGTNPNVSSGSWTFSIPTNPILPGTTTGTFSGSGASLTALSATQLTTGTVPDARFPATLPAASGVNLTALNASNLGSGTVPDARFPATLPAASGANLTNLNAANFAKDVQISVFDPTVTVTTGDGLAYFVFPARFNGMNLVGVKAHVNTVSSSGAITIDIARCALVATGDTCSGTVVAPLSTKLTIDANESKSTTAAVSAVIDTANDDVATDEVYRIDVDGAGTGTLGLIMLMEFALP